jgi:signal transduction histidine kinase
LLRYQYRLRPQEGWTPSSDNLPVFRFYDLRPGKYSVEVRASIDGVKWSRVPAQMNFEVLSPWYLRWWAIALYVLLIAILLLLSHRLRVRMLLQLEKQRTRIAMDLHDEIGSGLGSIGILSSVAASQTLGEDQRQEMSMRIAETADELGTSLTDIVWSLRADATTLESLAYHLARRAESLFASDATQFTSKVPDDWPAVSLLLAVRRNLLLIALESLHNAAKHAHAENVTLQFEQSAGRKWLMQIEDDGCGLSNGEGRNGSGMGMESMKRRATEIGAEISFTSKNGHGTIVSLRFNPQAKARS